MGENRLDATLGYQTRVPVSRKLCGAPEEVHMIQDTLIALLTEASICYLNNVGSQNRILFETGIIKNKSIKTDGTSPGRHVRRKWAIDIDVLTRDSCARATYPRVGLELSCRSHTCSPLSTVVDHTSGLGFHVASSSVTLSGPVIQRSRQEHETGVGCGPLFRFSSPRNDSEKLNKQNSFKRARIALKAGFAGLGFSIFRLVASVSRAGHEGFSSQQTSSGFLRFRRYSLPPWLLPSTFKSARTEREAEVDRLSRGSFRQSRRRFRLAAILVHNRNIALRGSSQSPKARFCYCEESTRYKLALLFQGEIRSKHAHPAV